MNERMSRVNQTQMKKLLDLLSVEGTLKQGKVVYTNVTRQNFWKRIAIQLNSVEGGVYKNPWKWCKMWADWKSKTKTKANIILKRKKQNPEHPSSSLALSNLEVRLLKMIDYRIDEKAHEMNLEMGLDKDVELDNTTDNIPSDYMIEDYVVVDYNKEKSSDEEDDNKNIFSDIDEITYDDKSNEFVEEFSDTEKRVEIKDDKTELVEESSDTEKRVKINEKRLKKKKISLEEYKVKKALALEKEKSQQKSEELRLKAIELKLKGEELKLKELEMNKINYLTNIEEEKLKCFREISSSLKELLERTRDGNNRFHSVI